MNHAPQQRAVVGSVETATGFLLVLECGHSVEVSGVNPELIATVVCLDCTASPPDIPKQQTSKKGESI